MKIEAVDLFCGIGGLTHGLLEANIKVLAGLDNDPSCRYAYESNNHCQFIHEDISEYDFEKLKNLYSNNSVRILVGCAPCQPFSSYTVKVKNKKHDKRWDLLQNFYQAVEVINPHVVSMENVRGITKTDIFKDFVNGLEKLGYQIDYEVVCSKDYGVPQGRNRLVLLGSKLGKIQVPKKTHSKEKYKTVGDCIKHLPKLRAGETDKNDPIHRTQNLSPLNLERIRQSTPNRSWKDWDTRLLPNCYRKESGRKYGNVYGRMSWDSVSPTLTTQFFSYGSGRFGHPEQNRALSIREGALLQTFPNDYDFGKDISITRSGRHIGNAVPPRLGFVIGEAIQNHVQSKHEYAK